MKNENNYFFIQHFVDDFFKNNIIINHEIAAKEFKKIPHPRHLPRGEFAGQKVRPAQKWRRLPDEPIFGLLFPGRDRGHFKESQNGRRKKLPHLYFGTAVGQAGICGQHLLLKPYVAVFYQHCQRQQQNVFPARNAGVHPTGRPQNRKSV